MKVLLTNDDGIERAGLHALVRSFEGGGHEVWVVAPGGERSGSSSSLGTITDGVLVGTEARSLRDRPQVRLLAVDGPPALGVRAICAGAYRWLPDVVVSGVNPGFNTGRMVLHSGTVGAALTALSRDVDSIAISTSDEADESLATAATLARALAEIVASADGTPVALNVNVPGKALSALRGVAHADLSETSIADVSFAVEPDGVRVRRIDNAGPFARGTDADLLGQDWVSVTTMTPPWASYGDGREAAAQLHQWWAARMSSDPARTA